MGHVIEKYNLVSIETREIVVKRTKKKNKEKNNKVTEILINVKTNKSVKEQCDKDSQNKVIEEKEDFVKKKKKKKRKIEELECKTKYENDEPEKAEEPMNSNVENIQKSNSKKKKKKKRTKECERDTFSDQRSKYENTFTKDNTGSKENNFRN